MQPLARALPALALFTSSAAAQLDGDLSSIRLSNPAMITVLMP